MTLFASLFCFRRSRLFLLVPAAVFAVAGSHHLQAQFKFREPPNRQLPEALGEREGLEVWKQFLYSRSIGTFLIEGKLIHRSPGNPSTAFDFSMTGEWLPGNEHTRIRLRRSGESLLDMEITHNSSGWHWRNLMNASAEFKPVTSEQLFQPVQEDLPLTWSDLLMPFLDWRHVNYLGPTRHLGRPAHRFELSNPEPGAVPERIIITIDEDFAALLKADFYPDDGAATKHIRVGGFKQFDDGWMFSELNWEDRPARQSVRLLVDSFKLNTGG